MMPGYTAEELRDIDAYHAPIYANAAVDLAAWPVVLLLIAQFLVRPLYRVASRWTVRVKVNALARLWGSEGWAPTVMFGVLYFGLLSVLGLPQAVWLGFVHEHAHALSNESLGRFVFDLGKQQALLVCSVSALAFGVFGLARRTNAWWWLVGLACIPVLAVSAAVAPYRSALYVDQTNLPDGPLRTRLTQVLEAASVPFLDVKVVHTKVRGVRVQAMFAGTGPTRTILLTDTLLESMTEAEIAAAVAHEAGHVGESRWMSWVATLLAVVGLLAYVEWLFRRSVRGHWFGISERGDVRVLPVLVLSIELMSTLISPLTATRQRAREIEADAYAARLLGESESLASLLVKVARINKSDPNPPLWYVLSGVSHPTLNQRLESLAALEAQKVPIAR